MSDVAFAMYQGVLIGLSVGILIVCAIHEYRMEQREIDEILRLSDARVEAKVEGFREGLRAAQGRKE